MTSSGPFRHDKRECAGVRGCIRRRSDHKLHHTHHVACTYPFFFRCPMNQSVSARAITSQPGYGLAPVYSACSGQFRVCACGCLPAPAGRSFVLFYEVLWSFLSCTPLLLANQACNVLRTGEVEVAVDVRIGKVVSGQHSSAYRAWHQFAFSTYVHATSLCPPKG